MANTFGGFLPDTNVLTVEESANTQISSGCACDILTYDAQTGLWKNQPMLDSSVVQYIGTTIHEPAHGFGIMDQVYKSSINGEWDLARADSIHTLRQASVYAVPNPDTFVVIFTGLLTIHAHGFEVGATYYLSATVAGAVTKTPVDASTCYNQPIFTPIDENTLRIHEEIFPELSVIAASANTHIAPANLNTPSVQFHLASYANNASGPYADAIHLNTGSSEDGNQNTLMFSKQPGSIAARLFQGEYQATTSYERYKDFVLTEENSANISIDKPLHLNFPSGTLFTFAGSEDGARMTHGVEADYALSSIAGRLADTNTEPQHNFWVQEGESKKEVARFDYASNAAYSPHSPQWSTLSDARVKKNVRGISDCLKKIRLLKPRHFRYTERVRCPGTFTGFVAQDLEEVLPGHVKEIHDGFRQDCTTKAISGDLTPYVVGAIQELSATIDLAAETLTENHSTLNLMTQQTQAMNARIQKLLPVQENEEDP